MQETLTAFALACFVVVPAAAQDADRVEIERVRDRDEITLDPAKAYLLIEAPGMLSSNWIALPSEEQRADWDRQRSEALAEAIEDYPREMSRYERQMERYDPRMRRGPPPERPIEPTEESFAWPDLESRRVITIGPQNRFVSESGLSIWLYEVPEGAYAFYGLGLLNVHVDCACMGSVSFDVPAGQVTAVRIGQHFLDARGEMIDEIPDGTSSTDIAVRLAPYVDPPSPAAYDPRIPREMIEPAQFEIVERLPNWFGGTINRVLPIANILTYEGGMPVDLREGG